MAQSLIGRSQTKNLQFQRSDTWQKHIATADMPSCHHTLASDIEDLQIVIKLQREVERERLTKRIQTVARIERIWLARTKSFGFGEIVKVDHKKIGHFTISKSSFFRLSLL